MDTIFFLRSYGDFIVALYALKNKKGGRFLNLYASQHLQPLYNALPLGLMPEATNIHFIDLGIRNDLLSCFTNRFFFTGAAVNQLIALRKCIHALDTDISTEWYLEQSKRKWLPNLFSGKSFRSIHEGGNVYGSYENFFDIQPQVKEHRQQAVSHHSSIIIFPCSRKPEKSLPAGLTNRIATYCVGKHSLQTAHFLNNPTVIVKGEGSLQQDVYYSNFSELISLIQSADFIISADSLPAHLAQLLNKPHWILYNQKINTEWLTPYALAHGYYSCFDEFEKLKLFLTKG